MNWRPFAFLLVSCLSACSSTRLADAARSTTHRLDDAPERYIVAGVDNDAAMPAGHAGSSPRGYDGLTVYGPSSHARQLLASLEREYDLREVTAWPIAPLHMDCAVLEIPASADRETVLAVLAQDKRVRIAQPLQSFATQSAVYDDPYVGLQRGFQQLDVEDAHPLSRGAGVRIAIIDTGADTEHPDLRGAVIETRNFVDADGAQFKRDRHGTELAGIIAAVANNHEGIVGIAPQAKLSVYKACWQLHEGADAARCNSFTLAQALAAAIDARVHIVNLSLAGPADPLLGDLIREALHRGIVFVGAAPVTPGSAGHLLDQDGILEVASGGIQGGPGTPLHAPGEDILTLLPGGHYDFASGASLATAHVTGTVALLLARDPKLSPAALYQLLRETTAPVAGGGDSIDACAAIAAVVGHGECRAGGAVQHRVASGTLK
jgi:hypothetical protein